MKASAKAATRSKSMAAASVAPAPASTWRRRAPCRTTGRDPHRLVGPLESDTPGNGGLEYGITPTRPRRRRRPRASPWPCRRSTRPTTGPPARRSLRGGQACRRLDAADRETLLEATASLLEELDGAMHGLRHEHDAAMMQNCTSGAGACTSWRRSRTDVLPNTATAAGVLGAVTACVDGDVRGKTFVVHGCGGVGGAVAAGLVSSARPRSRRWTSTETGRDPGLRGPGPRGQVVGRRVRRARACSASGVLTAERASELICRSVVGASNLPFASVEARRVAEARCVVAPEGVTSAGAVIVDSIEHYAPLNFGEAPPSKVYDFTFEAVRRRRTSCWRRRRGRRVAHGGHPARRGGRPAASASATSWLATDARTGSAVSAGARGGRGARDRRAAAAAKMAGRRSFSTSARTCDTLAVGGGIYGLNIA